LLPFYITYSHGYQCLLHSFASFEVSVCFMMHC
jgi:hypothetical protein